MGEMILAFLNSTTTVYVLWALCLLSFLFFVGYAVSREGGTSTDGRFWGRRAFTARSLFYCDEYFYPVYLHRHQQRHHLYQFHPAGVPRLLFAGGHHGADFAKDTVKLPLEKHL